MSHSTLTYNITRQYPYRWYTPTVVVDFTLAAAFFSFINYVSSGYTLQAAYLLDANATTWSPSDSWLKNWPAAFVGNIKPTCQPSSIPVGTVIPTNSSALLWTITNVTRHTRDTTQSPSSLVYKSHVLEDCQFRSITLYLDSYLGIRNAPQIDWSYWGAEVEGRMYCRIYNPDLTYVNITAKYNLLPRTAFENNETSNFPGRNISHYSLWWAESVLSANWWDLVDAMRQNAVNYTSGVITLELNDTIGDHAPNFNIRSLFLVAPRVGSVHVSLGAAEAVNMFPGVPSLTATTAFIVAAATATDTALISKRQAQTSEYADITWQVKALGTSFLSTMWTDLGQAQQGYNVFNDPLLLQDHSKNMTNTGSRLAKLSHQHFMGPETKPYVSNQAEDNDLGVSSAIFATTYLCQVPQRKPWGSLITSILVADLVLLRTLWAIVTSLASYLTKRHDFTANLCETCLRRASGKADHEEEPAVNPDVYQTESKPVDEEDRASQRSSLLGVRSSSRSDTTLHQSTERISEAGIAAQEISYSQLPRV